MLIFARNICTNILEKFARIRKSKYARELYEYWKSFHRKSSKTLILFRSKN